MMYWQNAAVGPGEFTRLINAIPGLSREDREDLCSETAIRICLYKIRPGKTKWTLARRIARNLAKDLWKHRSCRAHPTELRQAHIDVLVSVETGRPDDRPVRSEVCRLNPEMQAAVKAVFFDGLKYDEAARKLNVCAGTLRSRVHRALEMMREHLKRSFMEAENGYRIH